MISFFGIISSKNFIQCLEKWSNKLLPFATINQSHPYDIIVDIYENNQFNIQEKIKNIHIYWKFLKPGGVYVLEKIPLEISFQIYIDIYKLHQQYHFKDCIFCENSIILIKQNEHFE